MLNLGSLDLLLRCAPKRISCDQGDAGIIGEVWGDVLCLEIHLTKINPRARNARYRTLRSCLQIPRAQADARCVCLDGAERGDGCIACCVALGLVSTRVWMTRMCEETKCVVKWNFWRDEMERGIERTFPGLGSIPLYLHASR
jgi:hypothetical protein